MRSLVSDDKYFEFLNGINDDILAHTELAAVCLIVEFPHLRAEEAKAVWKDWRTWRKMACAPRKRATICEGRVTDEEKLATSGM